MTREEAIDIIENKIQIDVRFCTKEEVEQYQEALTMAITALRPVSREEVEKVWKGEWEMVSNGKGICSECHRQDGIDPLAKFCRYCGAPMTDEAMEILVKRMEELWND